MMINAVVLGVAENMSLRELKDTLVVLKDIQNQKEVALQVQSDELIGKYIRYHEGCGVINSINIDNRNLYVCTTIDIDYDTGDIFFIKYNDILTDSIELISKEQFDKKISEIFDKIKSNFKIN